MRKKWIRKKLIGFCGLIGAHLHTDGWPRGQAQIHIRTRAHGAITRTHTDKHRQSHELTQTDARAYTHKHTLITPLTQTQFLPLRHIDNQQCI